MLLKQVVAHREVRVRRVVVLGTRRIANDEVGEPAEAQHEVGAGLGQTTASRDGCLPILTTNRVEHLLLVNVASVPA